MARVTGGGQTAIRVLRADDELPVHFFTIVLNGEPFIRYHLDMFRSLPFPWHWHVVEGVASLVHDTAWSVAGGGRIEPSWHADGLSVDGTTAYLDEVAAAEPQRTTLYRKRPGQFWDGKREMVSAPLPRITQECLLWQVDADEFWTADQIVAVRNLFLEQPDRTAAYYWCDYFVSPEAVVTTRYGYAANPRDEWLRTWRYRPGDPWQRHEPPVLARRRRIISVDLGYTDPFLHDETEAVGAVFQHFAYATEEQVRFKESYYGYVDGVEAWQSLRKAVRKADGPLRLRDHLPWVEDDTLVDLAERRHVRPIARASGGDGAWVFSPPEEDPGPRSTSDGPIVVDGVFFQHFLNTGIARVWRSNLEQWLTSGFARRVLFLDRGGAGPRLPGLPTRSIPVWNPEAPAEDSLLLQRVCDEEGAALFVSTYYTTPIDTPSLMLVHDLIPREARDRHVRPVMGREAESPSEHASFYVSASRRTPAGDLLELEPAVAGKPAEVVPLGVADALRPATDDEVQRFRRERRLERPYFLLVGDRRGVGGYKNTQLLFQALAGSSELSDHEVLCVGGQPHVEPDLRKMARKVRARRLSLSDEEASAPSPMPEQSRLSIRPATRDSACPSPRPMACGCPD